MLAIATPMARNEPPQPDRVSAHTSKRVARMSEKEREEVARKLAERKATVPDPRPHRAAAGTDASEASRAEEAARITAELSRTDRRLDRMERAMTRGRYQKPGGGGPATGRYGRLLTRAERLERQLRSLG